MDDGTPQSAESESVAHHSGGADWCVTCGQIGCVEYADGPGYYGSGDCPHDWLDHPESDTHECLLCGTVGTGPIPVRTFLAQFKDWGGEWRDLGRAFLTAREARDECIGWLGGNGYSGADVRVLRSTTSNRLEVMTSEEVSRG